MGNTCGQTFPMPDTRNVCTSSLGYFNDMPNFCTPPEQNAAGRPTKKMEEYCSLMSNAGEWGNPRISGGCGSNSCNNVQEYEGHCGSCHEIPISVKMQCRRLKFTGDNITCCFNDWACSNQSDPHNPRCFSDTAAQNTCNPDFRSITNFNCKNTIFNYCTGTLPTDDPNSLEWLNRWTDINSPRSCLRGLLRNLLIPNPGDQSNCFDVTPYIKIPEICNGPAPAPYSSTGYFWAQNLMKAVFERYKEQGFEIGTLPGFEGYNPFQDFLFDYICCGYPGLCQTGLQSVCVDKNAERLSLNPSAAKWCGCHLPPDEYESYANRFNIQAECSPICNRQGVIPIVGNDSKPILCQQTSCIIDNITVNLVNAEIGDGIQFNQICGTCPEGSCSCIISDTSVNIGNSTVGGNVIPALQNCSATTCVQPNQGVTGPVNITIECNDIGFNPQKLYNQKVLQAETNAQRTSIFWTALIVGISLILIFLLIWLFYPRRYIIQVDPIK